MFDIGLPEMIVIGVVALIVLGPDKLPDTFRTIGRVVRQLRDASSQLTSEFQRAMDEGMREETPSYTTYTPATSGTDYSSSWSAPASPEADTATATETASDGIEAAAADSVSTAEGEGAVSAMPVPAAARRRARRKKATVQRPSDAVGAEAGAPEAGAPETTTALAPAPAVQTVLGPEIPPSAAQAEQPVVAKPARRRRAVTERKRSEEQAALLA